MRVVHVKELVAVERSLSPFLPHFGAVAPIVGARRPIRPPYP